MNKTDEAQVFSLMARRELRSQLRSSGDAPTWRTLVPLYAGVLRNRQASHEGITATLAELTRMAIAADAYNTLVKVLQDKQMVGLSPNELRAAISHLVSCMPVMP